MAGPSTQSARSNARNARRSVDGATVGASIPMTSATLPWTRPLSSAWWSREPNEPRGCDTRIAPSASAANRRRADGGAKATTVVSAPCAARASVSWRNAWARRAARCEPMMRPRRRFARPACGHFARTTIAPRTAPARPERARLPGAITSHHRFAERSLRELGDAVCEQRRRAVAQHARGPLGRCEDMSHVAGAKLAGDDRRRAAGGCVQREREIENRARLATADVEHSDRRVLAFDRKDVRMCDIADMYEVTTLAAVLEDARGTPLGEVASEDAGDSCVRRISRHARPVHVVVPEPCDGDAREARRGEGEMLLVQLCRRIHALRLGWPFLGHGDRIERASAVHAAQIEAACAEVAFVALARSAWPTAFAHVRAFAIHRHAAREHETRHGPFGARGEQLRRAEVVRANVAWRVADPAFEPDDRGLMAHGLDAVQRVR